MERVFCFAKFIVPRRGNAMFLGQNLRRQACACAGLADDCDDRNLAERLKIMAADLLAKADDFEELPSERERHALGFGLS
jgi:hypothetical protein